MINAVRLSWGCRHEGTRVDVVHCEKKMSNHAIRWAGSAIAAIWT